MAERPVIYKGFRADPVCEVLGAEILGLDLSGPIDHAIAKSLRRALSDHLLLYFRDQLLAPEHLCRFAEVFGELTQYPFLRPLPGHAMVSPVIKEPWDTGVFGGGWHTDTPYLNEPAKATLLYALEVPKKGGDTLYSNMRLAYATLPSSAKQRIASREGMFSSSVVHTDEGVHAGSAGREEDRAQAPDVATAEARHPLVRRHLDSGEPSLYVSPLHLTRIIDMPDEESESLIELLNQHATDERFVYKFKWQAGTLAIWDNRCLLHCPIDDYDGQRRAVHRVSVKGERPRALSGSSISQQVIRDGVKCG